MVNVFYNIKSNYIRCKWPFKNNEANCKRSCRSIVFFFMISRILDEGNYSINGVSLMMISRFKPQISDICEVDCNEYNLQDEPI